MSQKKVVTEKRWAMFCSRDDFQLFSRMPVSATAIRWKQDSIRPTGSVSDE